ncbi:MAG: hypothetical protein LUC91_08880, partial [Prevotella sp.]|nr:hypothetical protein [Prevotella sp.]
MAGYNIKQWQFEIKGYFTIVAFIIVCICSIFMPTNMLKFTTWQIIPYCLCAVSGTLMVVYVSNIIVRYGRKTKYMMVWIGKHTLAILTWHFLSFKLISL